MNSSFKVWWKGLFTATRFSAGFGSNVFCFDSVTAVFFQIMLLCGIFVTSIGSFYG